MFSKKSQKKIRAYLSNVIDKTMGVFEKIARNRGLDFKGEKRNPDYIEFGGGNKMCTLKIWYNSEVLGRRSFMKVQINFVENICYHPKSGQLVGLLTGKHEELEALFPEYAEYAERIPFNTYDIREILSEKVRALLTREGTKARDFLDVYFICRRFGIKLSDVEETTVDKTNFTLSLYGKYRTHLKGKIALLGSGRLFEWGEERRLLLSNIDEADFYSFLKELNEFLSKIVNHLYY